MTTEHADQDRLALAEVTCCLAHVLDEAAALAERRTFPAMPDGRRATRLAELEMERVSLQRRHDELTVRVPDPEQVRAPDGTLPTDCRRANLGEYRARRREKLRVLEAKNGYLNTVLADKAAPREVQRRARDARATAANDIDVLNAEPSDEDLRPKDMLRRRRSSRKFPRLHLDVDAAGVAVRRLAGAATHRRQCGEDVVHRLHLWQPQPRIDALAAHPLQRPRR